VYIGSRRRAASLVTGPKNSGHERRSTRTSALLPYPATEPSRRRRYLTYMEPRNQLARARASGTPWRLTFNMLLSFAQFEREIAGERIRDKIAASKRKGMWMGGNVPLGYDVRYRKLIITEPEGATVRLIFRRYAELGSVALLKVELDRLGIVSKRREGAGGRLAGGQRFSRGALYLMLQNRIYRGDIVHQGTAYPGQHKAIIDPELWQIVQDKLAANRQERSFGGGRGGAEPVGRPDRRCRRQSDDADPCHKESQAIPLLRFGATSGWRSPASTERDARSSG
jgi:hypothetical protein